MASISITAPSSAEQGERVSVSVRVTSTLDYHASYEATIYAVPDLYPDYVIGSIDQIILSRDSVTRSASFTMPDCNVTVFVWVERWSKDHWVYDGSKSKVVSLEIPAPETFHLSVSVPSGGSITPSSGDYLAYSTVTLRAYPNSGYQFVRWGGDASGTSTTYNLYMNSNKNVTAYFEKVPVVVPCEILIDAPSSAKEGNRVTAYITIGNVSPYDYSYKATIYALPDLYPDYVIGSIDQVITSGSYVTRSATFTMPDCNTTVFVWVERWAVDHWVYDNADSKVVSLEVVPEYRGTISKKELDYDGKRSIIPVY